MSGILDVDTLGPRAGVPAPAPAARPPVVRWELMLPAGDPVPASLGGFYEAFASEDDGATTLWVLLPVPGDRPEHDPRLPQPAYVVDNFLEPIPPLRAGETDGDRRMRYRLDAAGDLVKVLDEPWDPRADPVYGPAFRAFEQGE